MKKIDLFNQEQDNEKSESESESENENEKEDFNCQCSLDNFSSLSSLSDDDLPPTLAPTPLDIEPHSAYLKSPRNLMYD